MTADVVRIEAVEKSFDKLAVLRGIDLAVGEHEVVCLIGASGSGKSTLMQCMAGLDQLTSGQTWIGDVELTGLSEREITKVRRDRVGFIFQSFNLVPTLSALENIRLPLDIAGREPEGDWMEQVIDALHLRPRLKHRPSELSGGQQQRVAVARALVNKPAVVFADEPTGNLDSKTSAEILELMRQSTTEFGQTIVIVTHDARAAAIADRVVFLSDGCIVADRGRLSADEILDQIKSLE